MNRGWPGIPPRAGPPMKFCPNCNRAMARHTATGSVKYRCACGVEVPGLAIDARVRGAVLGTSETSLMYARLIGIAPYDRTTQVVARDCPKCGLDYMCQIRVGDAEVIITKCKCGYEANTHEKRDLGEGSSSS